MERERYDSLTFDIIVIDKYRVFVIYIFVLALHPARISRLFSVSETFIGRHAHHISNNNHSHHLQN